MHRLDDLILEAVENSREAGALNISVIVEEDAALKIQVIDDGVSPIPENPFADGVSTKGKTRGRGEELCDRFLMPERDMPGELTLWGHLFR